MVGVNPGPPGKWPLKRTGTGTGTVRDRDRERQIVLYRRADQVPGGADDGESDAEQGDLRHPRWTATSQRQPQASDPGQHR